MNRTGIAVATLTLILSVCGYGGDQRRYFTGSPKIDLFSASVRLPVESREFFQSVQNSEGDSINVSADDAQGKSPWLAGVLSLALPGAGELYAESYWKSGIFVAVEAAVWIAAYTYDKKGDRQTDFFQAFADMHWSVVRYAQWMKDYQGRNFFINPDANLPPWERVQWDTLNFYERLGGFAFTHVLPIHGEQQYYELIGKYHQYSPGWDDYTSGSDFLTVSPRFKEYSAMRGRANDYYNIASTAVSVLIVNHVLSAIDAFFTASNFNRAIRLEARMNLRQTPFGPVAESLGRVEIRL